MSFCTVINCMDGRVQLPVIRYLMERFGIEYIDSITEAGPVRFLAEQHDKAHLDSIFERVAISTEKHGSRTIAVCAHADCAGNPVDDETQKHQLQVSGDLLRSRYPEAAVIQLWIDADWGVHEIVNYSKP